MAWMLINVGLQFMLRMTTQLTEIKQSSTDVVHYMLQVVNVMTCSAFKDVPLHLFL